MRFILQENESVYLDEHRMEEKNLKLKRTKMAGVMGFPCGNHLEHV
jgi:hypothetical protein